MTKEAFDWFEVDAQLVEQDATRISEENKAFLFYGHLVLALYIETN